jgi:DNA polymerase III sliding clamp (beta) subunit (PCNA family)
VGDTGHANDLEDSKAMKITTTAENLSKALPRLEAKSVEHGSVSAAIDCTVDGELTIGWNAGYILDLLKIVDDGPLTIAMQDAQSSAIFTLDGMQYLVMPMRI